MSKVLITGGSGFIGTNLIDYFLARDYEVINFDINTPRKVEHLNLWRDVDIVDYDSFANFALDFNPEYIVHLAARTDLDGQELSEYDANITGVRNLVRIANLCTELKRALIASSMLVCVPGYVPENTDDYSPHTVYGESKVITEKIIKESCLNCEWILLRPTSIWGPWFDIPYKGFFEMIMQGRYFHIGKKSTCKTFGFVGNSVHQIHTLLLSTTSDVHGKVFYLGDYEPYHIEEWADEIAKIMNFKIKRVPFYVINIVAKFGDLLRKFGIRFFITSFRLKNMTTYNTVDMEPTKLIVKEIPYTRIQGVRLTLDWLTSEVSRGKLIRSK